MSGHRSPAAIRNIYVIHVRLASGSRHVVFRDTLAEAREAEALARDMGGLAFILLPCGISDDQNEWVPDEFAQNRGDD
jgi:hypothetical protein